MRSASESQAVNSSSNWSTARRRRAFAGQRVERFGERILRSRNEHPAKLLQRPLAGTQQQTPPTLAARQDASGQGREKTGAQNRRLAAARRADDAEEAGADEAADELGHEPLPAEEVVRIDRLEACQAFERTDSLARHAGRGVRARRARACSRTSWRSTTFPVSSASTLVRSLLPAAAREATSTSRRLASSTATASAARANSRQLE